MAEMTRLDYWILLFVTIGAEACILTGLFFALLGKEIRIVGVQRSWKIVRSFLLQVVNIFRRHLMPNKRV